MRAILLRLLGAPLAVRESGAAGAEPADAIVVLGCQLAADGSLSPAGEERLRAGVEAWRRGLAPRLCMTGGRAPLASHDETEARALADRARALGVPAEAIEIEDASGSTWENARRCAALLHPNGIRRVWIATQPFHQRRARRHFRRAGFTPLMLAIDDSLQFRDPAWGLRRVLQEYVSWAKTLLLWR